MHVIYDKMGILSYTFLIFSHANNRVDLHDIYNVCVYIYTYVYTFCRVMRRYILQYPLPNLFKIKIRFFLKLCTYIFCYFKEHIKHKIYWLCM